MTQDQNHTPPSPVIHDNPEQKKVVRIYAALCAAILLGFVPHMTALAVSAILFLGVLFVAYAARRQAAHDSLCANHMTYIIRTLWITGLVGFVSIIAASVYMLGTYDPLPLQECADHLISSTATMFVVDAFAIEGEIKACLDNFLAVNGRILLNGTILASAPIALYLVFRLSKGLERALKGYRLARPRAWL